MTHTYRYSYNRRGFSLVELSIVLVILGLLVGGILTGRTLIRASELRSIITQHDQYYTAVQSFRQKYFYLPGDMPNATQFWGRVAVGFVACNAGPSASATAVCDGNGDGKINVATGSSATSILENFFTWQELANAGLIAGNDYRPWNTTPYPPGKIANALWNLWDYGGDVANAPNSGGEAFNGKYGNVFTYSDANNARGIMTPAEVWNIDVKMDDGKPGQGSLVVNGDTTFANGIMDCTTTNDATNLAADYLYNSTNKACWLTFRLQF